MHKVLDLLQLVYLKIDKKIKLSVQFLSVNSCMKTYQPFWKVNPHINLRNAEKGNLQELQELLASLTSVSYSLKQG